MANGINTVHLAYVREQTGHALIGAREWIPAEHLNPQLPELDVVQHPGNYTTAPLSTFHGF